MANILMTSTDFKSEVEPIINDAFDGIFNRDKEYNKVFQDVPGIPRAYHEEPVLYGFPTAPEMPEGTPVVYRSGGELFRSRFTYMTFGMAFALTKQLVEDGEAVPFLKVFAEHGGASMNERIELDCANILNRSFDSTYSGGDGVSLINTAHPSATGANFSNQITAAANLSYTSLQQLLIQVRRAKDSTQKQISLKAKKLVVSPDNMYNAYALLNSVLSPGNANNDVNAVKAMEGLDPVVLSRVTSTKAWWLQTDAPRGLRRFTRRSVEKSMEGDFETDSMRYKFTMRYIPGWVEPRCLFGSAGI